MPLKSRTVISLQRLSAATLAADRANAFVASATFSFCRRCPLVESLMDFAFLLRFFVKPYVLIFNKKRAARSATLIDYICMSVMSTNECLITRRWFAEQIAKDDNNCKNKQKLEQSKEPITFYVITPANHFPPQQFFRQKRAKS